MAQTPLSAMGLWGDGHEEALRFRSHRHELHKESEQREQVARESGNQVPLLLYSIPLLPELWAILSDLNFPDARKQSGRLEVHSGK